MRVAGSDEARFHARRGIVRGIQGVSKKTADPKAPPNYDYSGSARVARLRKALADTGGARVETNLSHRELKKLDALVQTRVAGASRSAVLKYLVDQLPEPELKDKASK